MYSYVVVENDLFTEDDFKECTSLNSINFIIVKCIINIILISLHNLKAIDLFFLGPRLYADDIKI